MLECSKHGYRLRFSAVESSFISDYMKNSLCGLWSRLHLMTVQLLRNCVRFEEPRRSKARTSPMNPVHISIAYLCGIHYTIILPSTPTVLLRSCFTAKLSSTFLVFPIHSTFPTNFIVFYLSTLTIFGAVYKI
jgi:hypothetical protein